MSRVIADLIPGGPALDYASGTLRSGSVSVTGLVKSIRLFADGSDGTVTIQDTFGNLSADTITIRQNSGMDLNFFYRLTSPTVTYGSGTIDYVIMFLPE